MARSSTIYDVAREAKVAPSTVSRAFSRPELLNKATVRSVLRVAERLNFQPNRTARSLSTGRTRNLAMFVPNIANPFFPDLMRSFHAAALRRGYSVFLVDTDETADFDFDLLAQLSTQIDGVALVAPRIPQSDLDRLVSVGRYVIVNRDAPGVVSVTIDSSAALEEAITDLHGLGHRRIVYARGPVGGHSDRIRRRWVKRVCQGLDLELIFTAEQNSDTATAVAAVELASSTGSTVVMAHSDFAAISILAACRDRSIRVPADLSVVGHDGIDFGRLAFPPLSTIDAKTTLTGRITADALIDLIESEQPPGERAFRVAAEYVRRESTAALRTSGRAGRTAAAATRPRPTRAP